jgi:hypothetical protein
LLDVFLRSNWNFHSLLASVSRHREGYQHDL